MIPHPTLELITAGQLLDRVRALREQSYRLVQIGATRLPEQMELTYSFDRDGHLLSLRLHLPASTAEDEACVPSISSIYGCAVLYENEMHDLFNIRVDGMALDFHGKFYRTTVKYSFATPRPPPARPASAVKPVVSEPDS